LSEVYVAALVVSFVGALAASPSARKVAVRLSLVDIPNARKIHLEPVPYFGGAAIVAGFALAVGSTSLVGDIEISSEILTILAGGLVISAAGLLDDARDLPMQFKLTVEVALAASLYSAGVRTHIFDIWGLDFILTLGWIVGITNAVNLMDNMDGLTAGISAIAASYLLVLGADYGQAAIAALSAALAGSALGFLWHNLPPARIFMGDAGSLFLGFMLAALGLELRFENIQEVTFFVPVAILAVPILDTLMTCVARIRRGDSIFRAGRDHVSHRLVAVGISQRGAVALLYLAGIASGWLGVVIAYADRNTAYLLMGWIVGVGVFLAWLLMRVDVDP
jgi:UDP-GlcNAc:undecaprenyl-phosphate/decaprenyl-phosphate GlcNAc-1-phosphate transferase